MASGKSLPDRVKDLEEAMSYAEPRVVPAGIIEAYAGPVPPKGWLLCDGSALDKDQGEFRALYEAINESWGNGKSHGKGAVMEANDKSDFNIPDLRGVFLRGVDGNRGEDPNSAPSLNSGADGNRFPGPLNGNTGNKVGSFQTDMLAKHAHRTFTSLFGYSTTKSLYTLENGIETQKIVGGETRPKNAYVHYIIKL